MHKCLFINGQLSEVCYRCGKPAVSREHVPPLCLFPEEKDQPDISLRRNLITVPSCHEHNSAKSKDDEFLLLTLPSIVGNNWVGYRHTKTKLLRALKRLPKSYFDTLIARNARTYVVSPSERIKFVLSEGNPDYARFIRCFENVGAGLYFHEFRKVFEGEIRIHLGFVNFSDKNRNTYVSFLREKFLDEAGRYGLEGQNPEVFAYRFSPISDYGIKALKLVFYEGTDIYLAFIPKNTEAPSNLLEVFLKAGINTTITLGEKEFFFEAEKVSPD